MPGLESIGAFEGVGNIQELMDRATMYIDNIANFVKTTRASLEEAMQVVGVGLEMGMAPEGTGRVLQTAGLMSVVGGMPINEMLNTGYALSRPFLGMPGDMTGFLQGYGEMAGYADIAMRGDPTVLSESIWRGAGGAAGVGALMGQLGVSEWNSLSELRRAAAFSVAGESAFNEYARTGELPSGLMDDFSGMSAEERYSAMWNAGQWIAGHAGRLHEPLMARWMDAVPEGIESDEARAAWLWEHRGQRYGMTMEQTYALAETSDMMSTPTGRMQLIGEMRLAQDDMQHSANVEEVTEMFHNVIIFDEMRRSRGFRNLSPERQEEINREIAARGGSAMWGGLENSIIDLVPEEIRYATTAALFSRDLDQRFNLSTILGTQFESEQAARLAADVLNEQLSETQPTFLGFGGLRLEVRGNRLVALNEAGRDVTDWAMGTDIQLSAVTTGELMAQAEADARDATTTSGISFFYGPQAPAQMAMAVERFRESDAFYQAVIGISGRTAGTIGAVNEVNLQMALPTEEEMSALRMRGPGGSAGFVGLASERLDVGDINRQIAEGEITSADELANIIAREIYGGTGGYDKNIAWADLRTAAERETIANIQGYYYGDTRLGRPDVGGALDRLDTELRGQMGGRGMGDYSRFYEAFYGEEFTDAERERLINYYSSGADIDPGLLFKFQVVQGRTLGGYNDEAARNLIGLTGGVQFMAAGRNIYEQLSASGAIGDLQLDEFMANLHNADATWNLAGKRGEESEFVALFRELAQGGISNEELVRLIEEGGVAPDETTLPPERRQELENQEQLVDDSGELLRIIKSVIDGGAIKTIQQEQTASVGGQGLGAAGGRLVGRLAGNIPGD